MKNWVALIVLLLIFAGLGFLVGNGCKEKKPADYSGKVTELEQDTLEAGLIRDSLTALIDSLEKIPDKIWRQVIVKLDTIDRRIEKDSTQAIVAFREGLQLWNWLPDKAEYPTYRELGLMAKIAVEGDGLKLKVKLYEEKTIPALKADIQNYQVLYQGSKELNKIKDLTINDQAIQIKDANAWYNHKILWLGIGGALTGLIVYLVK